MTGQMAQMGQFFKAVNHALQRLAAGRRDTKIWRDRCKPLADGTRRG